MVFTQINYGIYPNSIFATTISKCIEMEVVSTNRWLLKSVSKSGLMLSNAGWSGWAPTSTSRAKRLGKYLTTRREFLKSISKSMSKSFWNFNMYSKSKLKDERRYTQCGILLLSTIINCIWL